MFTNSFYNFAFFFRTSLFINLFLQVLNFFEIELFLAINFISEE